MRNPAIFWGVMALLQVFWIIIALGAYWWLRPLLPKRPHPWLAIFLTALVGNGLLLAFNTVLPEWRWRGTMAVLLFATYALMFSLMWTLVHTLLRWMVARRLLNRSIRVLVPVAWLAAIAAGLYNAYVPTVVHYQVKIDKPLAQPLRIALVSDTQLGRFIGARHLRELQTILKRERADVLLLAGDVMDDVPTVYRKQHMARLMSGLKTPLGQYAVLGNHDNYGGEQQGIVKDLQAAGFTTLRDEHTTVNQQFVLVGRRDKVENRASAAQVIPKSDLPVIVMDHQPADMDAIANTRADLVVSGHTHRGQVFPATLLINYFQTYPYGHYRIDNSQLVVTSGYGLWGLPFRLGARSEVAIIELIGK